MLVTVDDDANCPQCVDDPPATYQFSFEVEDDPGCQTCGGGSATAGGVIPATGVARLESVSLRFPLGPATDGEPAGLLRIHESQPTEDLATPATLKYKLRRADVEVIRDPNNPHDPTKPLRQIRTPKLLVDIFTIDAYSYEIRYFALEDVGTKVNGLYQVDPNDAYRVWKIENPDGSNGYDKLYVTEWVDDGTGARIQRVQYQYQGTVNSSDWVLTIRDMQQNTTVQTEEIQWVAMPDDSQGRARKKSIYKRKAPDGTVIYREDTVYTQFSWGWRRTQRTVDPAGAALVTKWTWDDDPQLGLVLKSVERPDGSWTVYDIGPGANNTWAIIQTSGLKDEPFDPNAAQSDPVRQVVLTYNGSWNYRLQSVREYVQGTLVRAADYTHTFGGTTILGTSLERWADQSGRTKLQSSWGYFNGNEKRYDYVEFPDGRRDDYDYDDTIAFTPGTPPTTPPSYDLAGDDGRGYRYREVVHGYASGGTTATVSGQSTKQTVILDPGGLPVFEETFADVNGSWVQIGWVTRVYDRQGRLTDVYRSDGTYQTITYSSCCGRTVTNSTGVSTTYSNDVLGRPALVTRNSVPAADGFPAQPAIQTQYDYSVPLQTTITVSSGGLSQVTRRTFDRAGRLTGVTTGTGSGALKTIYEYGTTGQGGRKVTVYDAYGPNDAAGTPGVRDRVTEYYRDGRVRSVTGSTVTGTFYDYGVETDGRRWTLVATGTSLSSPRYEKTWRDMLGRVQQVERPGWASGGSVPLITSYSYDSITGLLTKVSTPGQADTLYQYGLLGNVEYTALDVNGNGQIDLAGPDRVTRSQTLYESPDGDTWRISRAWAYPLDNDASAVKTSETRVRLTGLGGGLVSEVRSYDVYGNLTTTTVTIDTANALWTQTIDAPDSSQLEVRKRHGGRLVEVTTRTGVTMRYEYDALGRQTKVKDGRGNETQTFYDAAGRVSSVQDAAGNTTEYGYYLASESGTGVYPGRLKYVRNALLKSTCYGYDDRGQTIRVWGDVPYPVENVYDDYGQRIRLRTWRSDPSSGAWTGPTWPDNPPAADETTWSYHAATGLLERKTYADGTFVEYTYTAEGRLATRKWARDASSGKVTSYQYDPATGLLTDVTYDPAWGMADIHYTYDRLGRRKTVTDAAGTRSFAYDPATLELESETFTSGMFAGRVITSVYEDGAGGTVAGRWAGVQVGTSNDPDADYAASYGYDALGRLDHVTGPGLPGGTPSGGAWYTFHAQAGWVERLEFRDASGAVRGWTKWTYETQRDLIDVVENHFGPLAASTLLSKYDYAHDAAGRRTEVVRTGAAFVAGHKDAWGYNDRNELTTSDRYNDTTPGGTTNPQPAFDRSYDYDPIGNRTSYDEGDPASGGTPFRYVTNELNQYTRVNGGPTAAEGLKYDADGNLTDIYAAADVNRDGVVDIADLSLVQASFGCQAGDPCYNPDADIDGNGVIDLSDLSTVQGLFGTPSGAARLTWDAENRLVGYEPVQPAAGDAKVAFTYDYLGRRVEKKVWTWDPNGAGGSGAWVLTSHRRFVWYNWLLLVELDAMAGDVPLRKYTWGRDLAGQQGGGGILPAALEAAGGIGGLLTVWDSADTPGDTSDDLTYIYFYDAHGNVSQVVDVEDLPDWQSLGLTGPADWHASRLAARYEYDPYGNLVGPDTNGDGTFDPADDPGPYASRNPFRFSTKSFDDETGFGSWGYRYHWPKLGRWLSRDPIGELGGVNLYVYTQNTPTMVIDGLGHLCVIGNPCGGSSAPDLCPDGESDPATSRPDPLPPGFPPACPTGYSFVPGRACVRVAQPRPPATLPPDPCVDPVSPDDCVACFGPCRRGYHYELVSGQCVCAPDDPTHPGRVPNNPAAPANGCSSPFGNRPAGFDFEDACNNHDRCYGTCGKTKQECDEEFLEDMLEVCSAYSGKERQTCHDLALLYHKAVALAGRSSYCAAQAAAGCPTPPECQPPETQPATLPVR